MSTLQSIDQAPGTCRDGAAETVLPVPATPNCVTLDQFVAEIIYDGRFIRDFTTDPELVAMRLGVGVAPEIFDQIRGRPSSAVLAEVTDVMTRECGQRMAIQPGDQRPPDPVAGIVVIGVIVIICVLLPEKPAYRVRPASSSSEAEPDEVVDNSAEAHLKL
jgi:hypothetical protein